jgi:hypothetical protein
MDRPASILAERPLSLGVGDSSPASPSQTSPPRHGAAEAERAIATQSAADTDVLDAAAGGAGGGAGWELAGLDGGGDQGGDHRMSAGAERSSLEGGGGGGGGGWGGGGGHVNTSDTEIMRQMDGLLCATRGADKDMVVAALELLVRLASAILDKPGDDKVQCVCVCVCVRARARGGGGKNGFCDT